MKLNYWTLALATAGVVSLASAIQAEEATESVKTLVSSTTLSGYVSTSAHWNPGSIPGLANYRYGNATKADGFNLDVIDLTVSKPLDEGEWSAGYKAELWFGPDAAATAANPGLGNNIAAVANASSIAIKQAYVALRAPLGNGLDFKLGIFDSIIGYESQNATDNQNYTRSWGNAIDPTSLTGILAAYRFNDIVSVAAGVANTVNAAVNGRAVTPALTQRQSTKAYTGSITLTAPDSLGFVKGGTLTAGVVDGRTSLPTAAPPGGAAGPDLTSIYVGATIPTPIESLKLGVAWDHLQVANKSVALNTSDADAIAGYVSYQATEKLKLNLRGEYFDPGAAAAPLPGFGPSGYTALNPGTAGAAGASAVAGEYFTATVTIDYALWANVISRLEYRWDHDLSGGRHFGGTTAATGVNNANLLALNVIYKF